MKKFFLLLPAAFCFGFTTIKHGKIKSVPPPGTTAGTYLFFTGTGINSNNIGDASTGHPNELLLSDYTGGETVAITVGGGGGTAGRPAISDIVLHKLTDKSTQRLRDQLLKGMRITTIELRIYNGSNTSPVYKVVLTNAFVTGVSSSAQPCSSGTCTQLNEEITIKPTGTIAWYNYPVLGSGTLGTPQIVSYDIATNAVTSSGL
jgi:type VI protein secretion system component Hcp